MKNFLSILFCGFVLFSTAQLKPTDLVINDSLGIFETGKRVTEYGDKPDSTSELKVSCGIADYFHNYLFNIYYKNGVSYMVGTDTMVLYMVDFRANSNEVEIKKLELESGMSLRKFERQISRCQCKNTREETQKANGIKEIAYTVYKDSSGLSYRVFFRDGLIHSLLLYIPCKD